METGENPNSLKEKNWLQQEWEKNEISNLKLGINKIYKKEKQTPQKKKITSK